ncbi:serine kinase [Odoribacter sp. OttesenSCG-928-J03]|nr:serine kinase [Odoribacter sp. OttesenSCG-928-J03]
MKVRDIVEKLELEVCSGAAGLDREIQGGYVSDLLSDVMGNAQEGNVWITLQTHKNIMAIASLKELAAVILVKGYQPEDDARAESEDEGIAILSTTKQTFEITGKLYELLKG